MLQPDLELGVGERTRRITTVRVGETTTKRERMVATSPPAAVAHARLSYRDNRGDHEHALTSDRTTIGRGGHAFHVDVRVSTSEDVSREHARIRRDAASGQFFLVDLSTLGTTLNGRHVPRGVEVVDGVKRENGAETVLPPRARIGLAETVFLEFEQLPR
jgi:hypothetical protein